MKKKQITLKSLTVKSFITKQKFNAARVRGGESQYCQTAEDPFFCGGYDEKGGDTAATDCNCGGGGSGNSCLVTCTCPDTSPAACGTDGYCTFDC